jgi:adenine-specific DNA-methyltransferase
MRKPANGYRFPEATSRAMEAQGIILYGDDEKRIVKIKKYLSEYEDSLRSVITLDGRLGSYELKRLFPDNDAVFTNPKPSELIESLVSFAADRNSLILDFFAGSGSTAHAVMALNRRDGGTRRFLLVQLPERTEPDSGAAKAGFSTISEITRERVRRAGSALATQDAVPPVPLFEDNPKNAHDFGFKAFSLGESNFTEWDAALERNADALKKQLELHVDHIRPGRTDDDILYELLLKSGFPLTTPVEKKVVAGKTVHIVADGTLIICLDRALTLEVIRGIADLKPERVVCLDEGFAGNDQLKTNAVQTFKTKSVTSFKTV